MPSADWGFERLCNCPSARQPLADRFNAKLGSLRPVWDKQSLAFMCEKLVVAPISSLRDPVSPAAVVGAIAKRVVDSVKTVALARARPHVGKKVFKLGPPIADGNTTTAIVFESGVRRVAAAISHAVPSGVFGCTAVPMRPVCSSTSTPLARLKEAILFGPPLLRSFADGLKATLTFAKPEALMFLTGWVFGKANYGPSAKLFAHQIDRISHCSPLSLEL